MKPSTADQTRYDLSDSFIQWFMVILHFPPFFSSGPHNLFLLGGEKKKSCKKSSDKLLEDGPTTNSICLFFCFCVHRQQVLRACIGWDKRHGTSADVRRYVRVFSLLLMIRRRLKTCVWSLILTIKLLGRSKKRKKHTKPPPWGSLNDLKAHCKKIYIYMYINPPTSCCSLYILSYYWTHHFL